MNNHDTYNGVPLPTRSAALQNLKNACLIREQAKRTPYTSIQALHGVAFHSEEDAAMYPQSPANSVASYQFYTVFFVPSLFA